MLGSAPPAVHAVPGAELASKYAVLVEPLPIVTKAAVESVIVTVGALVYPLPPLFPMVIL